MLTAISGRYTNTVGYAYDDAGRKSSESLTISGKTYTTVTSYNTKGQLTGYTYPDGTSVQRSYTDRGELHQLKHAGTTIDTRTYDNGGRMTGSSYNNGVSESRSYNSDNTLASISYSGASIGNLSYSWDDNKNKTAETISGTMSNYGFSIPTTGYDSEDRLVTFNRTSGLNQSWSLSAVGDWNSLTTNGTSQARTHGPTHELTAVAGNAVSTDVKGNMTLIPSAARPDNTALGLSWDMDNRLKSADVGNNGSAEVTYQFDALGRRVARTASGTTTVYVQSGQQTIADYTAGANSSSPLYRYVYASYIDEPVLRYQPTGAQSVYYHRNQQYSVTALTNSSGAILERYAYTAYGTPTITNGAGTVLTSSAHNNRYTYTGREWDQTISLYHYRARMYDPALGRFCSRDPIAYLSSTWNLFAYAELSPELLIDPSGLWAFPFGPISPGAYLRQQIDAAYAQMRDQMLYAASYASNKTKTLAKKILMWALSLPCPAAALVGGENCENYELRRESSYGVPIFAKDMVKWYWGGKATVCCSCDCRKISLSGKISGRLKSPARLMRGIANLVFSASGSITAKYKVCNGSPATLAGTLSATGAVTARRNVKFGIKNVPFLGPATVEIFGESGYYYTRQYSIPSFGLIRAEAGGFARFVGDMAFGKIHHRVSHSYTNGTLMPDFE